MCSYVLLLLAAVFSYANEVEVSVSGGSASTAASSPLSAPVFCRFGDAPLPCRPAEFGRQDGALTLPAVFAGEGCSYSVAVTGFIAVVDRGVCGFFAKYEAALAAGAAALVVINTKQEPLMGMFNPNQSTDEQISIPAVSMLLEDGARLKAALKEGVPISLGFKSNWKTLTKRFEYQKELWESFQLTEAPDNFPVAAVELAKPSLNEEFLAYLNPVVWEVVAKRTQTKVQEANPALADFLWKSLLSLGQVCHVVKAVVEVKDVVETVVGQSCGNLNGHLGLQIRSENIKSGYYFHCFIQIIFHSLHRTYKIYSPIFHLIVCD